MSGLSVNFVLRSISECVDFSTKAKRTAPGEFIEGGVCDLPANVKQLAVIMLSTISSAAMLAYKLSLCEQIRLRIAFRDAVKAQRDKLLEELNSNSERQAVAAPQAATAHPVQSAGSDAGAPQGGSGIQPFVASAPTSTPAPLPAPPLAPLNPEFTVMRTQSSNGSGDSAGPSGNIGIARLQGLAASGSRQAGTASAPNGSSESSSAGMRGICPGCNRSVLSTDDGRVKEGDHYYHQECAKGPCSKCGKGVYADQERARVGPGEPYYHIVCPA